MGASVHLNTITTIPPFLCSFVEPTTITCHSHTTSDYFLSTVCVQYSLLNADTLAPVRMCTLFFIYGFLCATLFEPLMNLHVTIKRYNSQCKQCNENKHTKDHQELPGGRGDVEAWGEGRC